MDNRALTDTARPIADAEPDIRRVFVRDLEIVTSVGVYEVEKRYEQRIFVSIDLEVRDDYDGVSDRLAVVLDYAKVVEKLELIAQERHVHLIETLAERFAAGCLEDGRVLGARVRIEKPDVLPACRAVGIEIVRRRRVAHADGA